MTWRGYLLSNNGFLVYLLIGNTDDCQCALLISVTAPSWWGSREKGIHWCVITALLRLAVHFQKAFGNAKNSSGLKKELLSPHHYFYGSQGVQRPWHGDPRSRPVLLPLQMKDGVTDSELCPHWRLARGLEGAGFLFSPLSIQPSPLLCASPSAGHSCPRRLEMGRTELCLQNFPSGSVEEVLRERPVCPGR